MIKKISLIFFFFTVLPISIISLLASKEINLYQAIKNNDLQEVKKLINEGAALNVKNEYGNTPLHFAAYYGHTNIVRYLIEKGANIYIENNDGEIPVYVTKKLEIVNILLEKEWNDDMKIYLDKNAKKNKIIQSPHRNEENLTLLKKISFSSKLAVTLFILKIKIKQ